ncbi:hypothetical protein D5S17_16385 [Pseudonocardiaceae bacterium YIM PH 21723]|nr:hypothetical protein D5S17_16385 [Pseudonocardiaceae bacterium YIM PH 21723]
MTWLFGTVWLWSLLSFIIGSACTWLLFVRPANRRISALEAELAALPEEQYEDDEDFADLSTAYAAPSPPPPLRQPYPMPPQQYRDDPPTQVLPRIEEPVDNMSFRAPAPPMPMQPPQPHPMQMRAPMPPPPVQQQQPESEPEYYEDEQPEPVPAAYHDHQAHADDVEEYEDYEDEPGRQHHYEDPAEFDQASGYDQAAQQQPMPAPPLPAPPAPLPPLEPPMAATQVISRVPAAQQQPVDEYDDYDEQDEYEYEDAQGQPVEHAEQDEYEDELEDEISPAVAQAEAPVVEDEYDDEYEEYQEQRTDPVPQRQNSAARSDMDYQRHLEEQAGMAPQNGHQQMAYGQGHTGRPTAAYHRPVDNTAEYDVLEMELADDENPGPSQETTALRRPVDNGNRMRQLFEPVVEADVPGVNGGPKETVHISRVAVEDLPGAPNQRSSYGMGAALPMADGASPGPEYVVKGSTETMRFHTQDSPEFDGVRAEVWFRTVGDAERAGFLSWAYRPIE